MLGMLGKTHSISAANVTKICKTKAATVEDLKTELDKGLKSDKKIEDFKDQGDLKTKDYAFIFGIH
jgi:hypothetical protein